MVYVTAEKALEGGGDSEYYTDEGEDFQGN